MGGFQTPIRSFIIVAMDESKTIEELKIENEYLKSLLEKNGISYVKPKEIQSANFASLEEKTTLYLSYFHGRDDVFAEQRINKEGKKSCYPVCVNKGFDNGLCQLFRLKTCNGCPNSLYHGLQESDLVAHLKGKHTYGIYPLRDDDLTYLVAADFDEEDFRESALAFYQTIQNNHYDALIEISQSGKGAHVWMFFDKAIKAKKARVFASLLLSEAMSSSSHVRMSSLDRLFPSQDFLPKGGFGNLIILPLNGVKAKEGKTVFVDSSFAPYPLEEQLSALSSTKKTSEEEVDLFLSCHKGEDVLGLLPKSVLKGLTLKPADFGDKEIKVILTNEIAISKAGLSSEALLFLRRLASVPNMEYYKRERHRLPIFNFGKYLIPGVLSLYREEEEFIFLPSGVLSDLTRVFEFVGVPHEIIDKRENGTDLGVSFKGTLYPEQSEALDGILSSDHGVFVAPTAFGKTVVGLSLIATLKRNALVVVPNLSLFKQWEERMHQFLDVSYSYKKEKDMFGLYYGSKKRLTGQIDIACIKSLTGTEAKDLLASYGLVIFDEVHHLGAQSFEKVARSCSSHYVYGFTATPKRSDEEEPIIYKTIGGIIYEAEAVGGSSLMKVLYPHFTHFLLSSEKKSEGYAEILSALCDDKERNELISTSVNESLKKGRHILVLSDRLDHLKALRDLISSNEDNILTISGDKKASEKKEFYSKLSLCKNGFVILSTGKYIGEGFDNSDLDTLYVATPFKWSGTLSQYVGRLNRSKEGKDNVEVHDYIDLHVLMFSRMYEERLRAYKKQGYTINGSGLFYEKTIFSPFDYEKKLAEDLSLTKKSAVIVTSSIDTERAETLLSSIADKVSLYSVSPINNPLNDKESKKTGLEANIIVIDSFVVWYGEINPWRNKGERQYGNIMRISDPAVAKDVLSEIKEG